MKSNRFYCLLAVIVVIACSQVVFSANPQKARVRTAAYNVACGQWTTPEKVAQEMKKHNLDILGLNEMPRLIKGKAGEEWCTRLAKALGMPHVYTGTISSANHGAPRWVDESGIYEGKYKAILSKTPLLDTREFELTGGNWNPASVVRAVTEIRGVRFSFYSLHVNTHWKDLEKVFREDKEFHVLGGGDYNHSNYPEFDKAANMRDGRWDVDGKKTVDRILYRPNGKVKCVFNDVIRPESRMSDHPYAVSVFEFDVDSMGVTHMADSYNNGLVAYYPFDGSANDASGNNNHGSVYGGLSYVKGRIGRAASFNGTDSYIDVPYSPTLSLTEWTISIWLHTSGEKKGSIILLGRENVDSRYNYSCMLSGGSSISSQYETVEDDFDHTLNSHIDLDRGWNHVVSLRTPSGKHQLYINGVLKDSGTWQDTPAKNNAILVVGRNLETDEPRKKYLDGLVDEVRIYNRALSESELLYLYEFDSATIRASIDISPATLNLKSRGKVITVYIELFGDYPVKDIDTDSVCLSKINGRLLNQPLYVITPPEVRDYDENGIPDLMVTFDRQQVISLLEDTGTVELSVCGKLRDGKPFEGRMIIRVIDKGKR